MTTPKKTEMFETRKRDLEKSFNELLNEPNWHLFEIRRQLYMFKSKKLDTEMKECVEREFKLRGVK